MGENSLPQNSQVPKIAKCTEYCEKFNMNIFLEILCGWWMKQLCIVLGRAISIIFERSSASFGSLIIQNLRNVFQPCHNWVLFFWFVNLWYRHHRAFTFSDGMCIRLQQHLTVKFEWLINSDNYWRNWHIISEWHAIKCIFLACTVSSMETVSRFAQCLSYSLQRKCIILLFVAMSFWIWGLTTGHFHCDFPQWL